jgi:hypothetical protein
MALARRLIERLFVLEVSSVPSPSGFSGTVTNDSRSGLECHAQLNTSRRFGSTSR